MANIQTSNPYEMDDPNLDNEDDEQCEDCGGNLRECETRGCPYASIEGV